MQLRSHLLIWLVIIITGCAATEERWKTAQSKNSIKDYEVFLKDYPNSKYSYQAKSRIDKLHWKHTKSINSVAEYISFLEKSPRSRYSKLALDGLIALRWQQTLSENTINSYQKFLKLHVESKYATIAKSKIEEMGKRLLRNTNRMGLKITNTIENTKELTLVIKELAHRYLKSAGITKVVEKNYGDDPFLAIIVSGKGVAEEYRLNNGSLKYTLYTGSKISGIISLVGSGIDYTKSYSGKSDAVHLGTLIT